MNEIDAVLQAWRRAEVEEREAVLATVVHVKGSAYRRPGARLLLMPDGTRVGSVSGGCLETDLARKAWWLTDSGRPILRVYDTTSDDDAVWEFGLGCNGVIHVLLEPLGHPDLREAMRFLSERRERPEGVVIATVVRSSAAGNPDLGQRLLLDADGCQGGSLLMTPNSGALAMRALDSLRQRRSQTVEWEGRQVFVEFIGPPTPLVIFGGGHDAIPLVALAKQVGWHVTVVDGRPAYARPDRFPGADRVLLSPNEDPLGGAQVNEESVVVFVTHNYPHDLRLLRRILPANPRYLGLLGPRVRAERLFEELGIEGMPPNAHAPVGLDLGADEPETIALSIVAEIQADLAGRSGCKLRERAGPIHPRIEHRMAA